MKALHITLAISCLVHSAFLLIPLTETGPTQEKSKTMRLARMEFGKKNATPVDSPLVGRPSPPPRPERAKRPEATSAARPGKAKAAGGPPQRAIPQIPVPDRGDAVLSGNDDWTENPPSVPPMEGPPAAAGSSVAALSEAGRDSASDPPADPPASHDREALLRNYLALLREKIEAAREYPVRALRMGLEGTVVVHLVVGAGGEIEEMKLAEPSPIFLLNRAALKAIQSLFPLPPLPPELGDRLGLTIPLVYRLEQSARR